MARKPTIQDTYPKNNQTNVKITDSIRVIFDTDLDSRYIENNVSLLDTSGEELVQVEGRVVYRKKTITFIPHKPLKKGRTYVFSLVGDKDLNDNKIEGIRSIIGEPFAGSYSILFTTELGEILPPPEIISPVHATIIRQKPVFSWIPIENAKGYEIQISKTNTFNTKVFPMNDEEFICYGNTLEPNIEFDDGIYYWRIRTVTQDGEHGAWSQIYQFNLSTIIEGKVTEEDESPEYEEDYLDELIELELIESFPKHNSVQIPTNVKNIYFRVIGNLNPAKLDLDSFVIEGIHISEDEQEESHGVVKGKFTLVESDDGTTYLIFTPEPLPQDEEEEGDI